MSLLQDEDRKPAPSPGEPRFSLIIPAHNEQQRIGAMLDSYATVFEDSEIIVILNGCGDATLDVVRERIAQFSNLAYIDIADAVGKGGAVRAGLAVARGQVVGYVDADGATPAQEMRRLFEMLGEDDAIVASRWMPGANVVSAQPLRRRIASRFFNRIVNILFGLRLHDTQCGAKVFRASALRAVAASVETSNLAFDVDLLYALRAGGFRIRETPTIWRDQAGSQVRLARASAQMFAAVMRLRLRHSLLRYLIPLFDHFWPTGGMVHRDGVNVLLLNWRDPENPLAGGAEVYLHEMAKRWVRDGHRVEWLAAGFRGAPRAAVVDGITIHRVGNAVTVYLAAAWEYLRHLRDRFDVIIDAENGIPFFSPLYSLKPKILLIHHVHTEVFKEHLPAPLSLLCIWLESWLMPRAYAGVPFVAVSESTREELLRRRFTTRGVAVVHNGVDSRLVPGVKAKRPTIVYLGRLKAYKRVDLLVRAIAELRNEIPDVVFRIVGSGDAEPTLRALVKEFDLEDHVVFEGFVSEDRKREVLQGAWVFATASAMEGWGISVIEANACGTPAVGFDVPGIRESIYDGVSGVLVRDERTLCHTLSSLLLDGPRRMLLSAGALQRASTFSWEASADRMMDLVLRYGGSHQMTLVKVGRTWRLINRREFTKLRAFSEAEVYAIE